MLCLQEDSAFYSLEFNPNKPGLLAAGGTELLILNIERDIESPDSYKAGEPNPHENQIITSVSWNRKVSHILASSSSNGTLVVWDLKTRKPISNISDKQPHFADRVTSLCWSPDQATQFAACFDNEKAKEIQLWDLRNMTGPFQTLNGAHKGAVHQIGWSEASPEVIWAGDRQKGVVAWELKTGRVLFEKEVKEEIFELKISKKVKGAICWSSTEGNVELDVFGMTQKEGALDKTLSKSVWAPKWQKCPSSASFGGQFNLAVSHESQGGNVSLWRMRKEESERSKCIDGVEELLEGGKGFWDKYDELGGRKTKEGKEELAKVWQYFKCLDMNYEEKLLLLGYSLDETITKTEKVTGIRHSNTNRMNHHFNIVQPIQVVPNDNNISTAMNTEFASLELNEAEDFFNRAAVMENLGFLSFNSNAPHVHSSNGPGGILNSELSSDPSQRLTSVTTTINTNWDAGIEALAKQNILLGNIEGAVDCLLKLGRYSEAMMLSYSHSPGLLESTIASYVSASEDNFIKKTVAPLTKKKWNELAMTYCLDQWKELAALVLGAHESSDFTCFRGERGTVFKVLDMICRRLQSRFDDTGEGWEEILQARLVIEDSHGFKLALISVYESFKRRGLYKEIWDILELGVAIAQKVGYKGNLGNEKKGSQMAQEAVSECVKFGKNSVGFRLASLFAEGNKRGKLAEITHRLWFLSENIQGECECPNAPYYSVVPKFPTASASGGALRESGVAGQSVSETFSQSQNNKSTMSPSLNTTHASPSGLRRPVVVPPPFLQNQTQPHFNQFPQNSQSNSRNQPNSITSNQAAQGPSPMKPGIINPKGPISKPAISLFNHPSPVLSSQNRSQPGVSPPKSATHQHGSTKQEYLNVNQPIPSSSKVSRAIEYLKNSADSIRSFERDPRKINEIKKGVLLLVDQLNSETLKPENQELVLKIIQSNSSLWS